MAAANDLDGGMPKAWGGFASRLESAIRGLVGFVLLVMTIMNVGNAASRYLFGIQVRGSDEFLAYSMVWLVMLGLPLVTLHRNHLALDMLAGAAGGTVRLLRDLLLHLLMAGVCFYAAWQSLAFLTRLARVGSRSMGLGVPMTIPHSALLVGFTATGLAAICLMAVDLHRLFSRTPGNGEERA